MDIQPRMPAPVLWATIMFAAGIIGAELCHSWLLIICFAIAAAVLALFRRYRPAVLICFASIGFVDSMLQTPTSADMEGIVGSGMFGGEVTVRKESDTSQSLTLLVDRYSLISKPDSIVAGRPVRMQVIVPTFEPEICQGDYLWFNGEIERVNPQYDLPDEVGYDDILLRNHIYFRCFVTADNVVKVEPSTSFRARLGRVRNRLNEAILLSNLDSDTKEFLATTLLGNTQVMSQDTRQMYAQAGLSHMLALSGMHVALIVVILSAVLWPFVYFGKRSFKWLITLALLWVYCAVCGFMPSVTRAVIMITIYITGQLMQRRTSPLNSLMLAALIIMVIWPESLFQIGFQLTFAAVLAIITFANDINPIKKGRTMAYKTTSYVALSVSAVMGTGLIAAIYFHTFPVYFLLSNVFAALLLMPVMCLGILSLILQSVGIDWQLLNDITNITYHALRWSASAVASLPGATTTNIYVSAWVALPYAATLGALKWWLVYRSKMALWTTLTLLVMTIAFIAFPSQPERTPRLYLARNTYHTDIVIDGGGSTLDIITTTPNEPINVASTAEFRYADYMGLRGIDSLRVIRSERYMTPTYIKDGNIIEFAGKRIALISSNGHVPSDSLHLDYAVVCRGFRADLIDVFTVCHPDTIILSRDLHPKREARYIEEADVQKIPYRTMRQSAWSICR